MRIRISDPEAAPYLASALNDAECCAAVIGDGTVDVFLPWLEAQGGEAQAHARAELLFFVRAWGGDAFEAALDG